MPTVLKWINTQEILHSKTEVKIQAAGTQPCTDTRAIIHYLQRTASEARGRSELKETIKHAGHHKVVKPWLFRAWITAQITADQPSAWVTCGFLDNKLNRWQNNVTSIQTILIWKQVNQQEINQKLLIIEESLKTFINKKCQTFPGYIIASWIPLGFRETKWTLTVSNIKTLLTLVMMY